MVDLDRLRQLAERADQEAFLLCKRAMQRMNPKPVTQTVLVAGMQRSGTNMLMDRLERSLYTDVFHERDERAFDNYRMRPLAQIEQLRRQSRAPCFVIKTLCELDRIDALMHALAPARTLWIVRDYRDSVRSALRSFGNFGVQVRRIADDPTTDDWRAGGMSDVTRAHLSRIVRDELNETSAAALIWYFRNLLYFERGFDQDDRVRLIAYESLVSDPDRVCEDVFSFVGLPFTRRITRHVFASSVRHQPLNALNPSVRILCEQLMARFARRLQPELQCLTSTQSW